MADLDYVTAFNAFIDELTHLEKPLAELSIGPRLIRDLLPAPSVVDGNIDLPSGEENICQICTDLSSERNVDCETFDTDDQRRDHAKIHSDNNTDTLDHLLSTCFPMIYEEPIGNDSIQIDTTEMAGTSKGRTRKVRRGIKIGKNFMKLVGKRRINRHQRRRSNDEIRIKIRLGPRYSNVLKLADVFVKKHRPKRRPIECNMCKTIVKPDTRRPTSLFNKFRFVVSRRYYPRSAGLRLVEHALRHMGKSLRYHCYICSAETKSCLAIRRHLVGDHSIALANYKLKPLSNEDAATEMVQRCFGDGKITHDSNGSFTLVRRIGRDKLAQSRPPVTAHGSGVTRFLNPFWEDFFANHCDNVYQRWVIPAHGAFQCGVCKKQIKAITAGGTMHRVNLIYHAVRHMEYCVLKKKNGLQDVVQRNPNEVGKMVLQCFGPMK